MIAKTVKIKCGWCESKSTAEEWEDTTYAECTCREQRRTYTSIYLERAFNKNGDTYYKCPKCSMWSRGSQLRITDTEDSKLLRLGGDDIVSLNK